MGEMSSFPIILATTKLGMIMLIYADQILPLLSEE